MKYLFIIIGLFIGFIAKSQIDENIDDFGRNNYRNFPNTNIGKSSLAIYAGLGHMPFTGNLAEYYNSSSGGTMSLDYYHDNNLAFSLSIMGTLESHLKEELNINDYLWTPSDTATFWSYGFSVGYSVLNKIHWRITPFAGIVLSNAKLTSENGNEYKIGTKPSPEIGINFSYRFINVEKVNEYSGASNCFGISARITYVPFAVYKGKVPFSGGIWYMTIGITPLNLF